jgi:hypothetical protein
MILVVTAQLWSISVNVIQVRIKIQLNTLLFGKTLARKDVASSSATSKDKSDNDDSSEKKDDEDDFSSKAQIMTLMTTDVDRVADFGWHLFPLIGQSSLSCDFLPSHFWTDSPIEIVIGSILLYRMLGIAHTLSPQFSI